MPQLLSDLSAIGINGAETARRLAQAVQRLYKQSGRINAQFAARLGIPSSDFLAFLAIAGTDTMTPKQLSEELSLSTGAVTAMLDRLEADGLVRRTPNPSDRRSTYLTVTAQGLEAKRLVYLNFLDAMSAAIATRPEAGQQPLIDLLDHITNSVSAAGAALQAGR